MTLSLICTALTLQSHKANCLSPVPKWLIPVSISLTNLRYHHRNYVSSWFHSFFFLVVPRRRVVGDTRSLMVQISFPLWFWFIASFFFVLMSSICLFACSCVAGYEGARGQVDAIQFINDGQQLVTSSDVTIRNAIDKAILVWDFDSVATTPCLFERTPKRRMYAHLMCFSFFPFFFLSFFWAGSTKCITVICILCAAASFFLCDK